MAYLDLPLGAPRRPFRQPSSRNEGSKMKSCKVERSRFIRVDTIWRILETQLFKLLRVDAFYTISDPKLFKMYAKINPKWLMGTSK